MSDLRAVRVRWHDSVRIYDGWDTIDHYRDSDHGEAAECVTVGWLVRDDDRGVVICLSRSREGKFWYVHDRLNCGQRVAEFRSPMSRYEGVRRDQAAEQEALELAASLNAGGGK